jgi:hypothetical protein
VSLKATLMGWFSSAGLYCDPYRTKFVGLQILKDTCDTIRWEVENKRSEKEAERAARKDEREERQEARAERKREKKRTRKDNREQ